MLYYKCDTCNNHGPTRATRACETTPSSWLTMCVFNKTSPTANSALMPQTDTLHTIPSVMRVLNSKIPRPLSSFRKIFRATRKNLCFWLVCTY
eukprot:COSAG02_NODE_3062_length_7447_cov_14.342678_4_plen_93_part_00